MIRMMLPKNKRRISLLCGLLLGILAVAFTDARAQCVFDYLAEIPLDTQEQAGPALMMFLLDDSGSMDWSIMMDKEDGGDDSGLYDGYGYVFDDPGDNNYSYYSNYVLPEERRMEWVSQSAKTNKMYYNPDSEYIPWPKWDELDATDPPDWTDPLSDNDVFDMDPDTPRSLPTSDDHTLDMSATYYDFGQTLTSSEIINAGGVIVDNKNEIIVDNLDPEYVESGSWYESSASEEYDGSSRYSNSSGSYATWTPAITSSGTYEVFIFYTETGTRDTNAKYTVHYAGGDYVERINQQENDAQWVSLGEFGFDKGTSGYIRVERDGESTGSSTSADAVKLVPAGTANVSFESSEGWGSASNGEEYGADYLYTNAGFSAYSATWTADNLDSSETYDIYARWTGGGTSRIEVEYDIYDGETKLETTPPFDQQENHGEWRKIAEGLSFSGPGVVKIDQNADSSGMCADAVAFMPSIGEAPINLVRAHYYVQADDSTMYLVNLDGEIEYWRINDENDNDKVDGVHELERVNDPPAEIVTGRSYDEERVNFANWYSFYRKRELAAKNAIANVINDIQGVYIGLLTLNDQEAQHALPINVNLDNISYDKTAELLGTLYTLNSSGSTPLRNGLKDIGEYFSGNYGDLRSSANNDGNDYIANYTSSVSYPFFTEDKGGACQHAFAIAMTDGYWNGGSPSVGNQDANTDNEFDGDPYADSYSSTLADVAMKYYKEDLNSDLSDVVPLGMVDEASHQHMVTYSISFGVSGTIDRDLYTECGSGGDCPDWPEILHDDPTTLDDLYHSAVNGRGKYINAGNPEELVDAMKTLKDDIESRLGSAASVATNSIQRTVGAYLYQGIYHTDNWYGDVVRKKLNVETGEILTGDEADTWSAKDQLDERSWDNGDDTGREIITYNGTSGVPFQQGQFSFTGFEGDDAEEEKMVNYLRGDAGNNTANGGSYRVRNGKLGDIVHSAPYFHDGVIYAGANDGMLHAFDADTGNELFAYVPKIIVDRGLLPELASNDYSHQFYVDNTPYVRRADSETLLVGGLRNGGKGYYCLDVSNPEAVEESNAADLVQWEYNAEDDDDLGYSYSPAYIVRTNDSDSEWVVIFGNGYGSVNDEAVLYVLDAFTGAVIEKFETGATGCNGLSAPAVIDVDSDGRVDYVYAGDLKGNMWKFDLSGTDASVWDFAYKDGAVPMPLVTVKNESGGQPITVEPDVMRMRCGSGQEGYLVVFGTGQYIGTTDFENTDIQTFYGIWDWQAAWPEDQQAERYLGEFTATEDSPLLSNPPAGANDLTLLQQEVTDDSDGEWREISQYSINYFSAPDGDSVSTTDHAGWFLNLNDQRARVIRNPSIRVGGSRDRAVVHFISSIPSESPCDAGGSSWLYRLSACNGGRTYGTQFDTTGDYVIDALDDPTKSGKSFDEMIYSPTSVEDMDYLTDSRGNIHEEKTEERPEGLRYWRVIQ